MQILKLIYLFISTIWLFNPFVVSATDAPITDIMNGAYYEGRTDIGYNVNGWLASSTTTAIYTPEIQSWPRDSLIIRPKDSAGQADARIDLKKETVIDERLHYADDADTGTPRFDGKISVRECGTMRTAYGYDCHGRLASSRTSHDRKLSSFPDYSTSYTYDRNANITSLSRQGITDRTALGNYVYGLHSRYSMDYYVNQLSQMTIEREGADYEGRTGVGATGKISNFWYDANGNLGRDMSRGILETRYNHDNLPTDVYFESGHWQGNNIAVSGTFCMSFPNISHSRLSTCSMFIFPKNSILL